jgi:hypothetical protein
LKLLDDRAADEARGAEDQDVGHGRNSLLRASKMSLACA